MCSGGNVADLVVRTDNALALAVKVCVPFQCGQSVFQASVSREWAGALEEMKPTAGSYTSNWTSDDDLLRMVSTTDPSGLMKAELSSFVS